MAQWIVKPQLQPIIEEIENYFHKNGFVDYFYGVLVFGSSTRDNEELGNDIDLLFIFQKKGKLLPKSLSSSKNFRFFMEEVHTSKPLDLFSYQKDEFMRLCSYQNELIQKMLFQGRIIRGTGIPGKVEYFQKYIQKAKKIFESQTNKDKEREEIAERNSLLTKPLYFG